MSNLYARLAILTEIAAERTRQTERHGDQSHLPMGTGAALALDIAQLPTWGPRAEDWRVEGADLARWAKERTDAASERDGDGTITFEHILTEEWAEVLECDDPGELRGELIQLAAVAVQMVEALDDRARRPS